MAFVVTTGANTGGVTTGTVAVAVPGGSAAAGDLLMVLFESQTGNPGPNLAGWTTLQSALTVGLSGTSRLTIGFKIADGTEGATQTFTCPATNNHTSGQMAKITGHGITAMADIVANGGTAAAGATFTSGATGTATTGVTSLTVTAGSLIFLCVSDALDATSTTQFSTWAVATDPGALGTEDFDNLNIIGNGGGIGMAHGICAGTTTGTGSVTRATQTDAWNAMLIGIKPAAAATTSLIWPPPAPSVFLAPSR